MTKCPWLRIQMQHPLQDKDDDMNDTGWVTMTPPDEEEYSNMLAPDALKADDVNNEILDKYLRTELIFNMGSGAEQQGRVMKRSKGTTGQPNTNTRTSSETNTLIKLVIPLLKSVAGYVL
jgi:hypothetical protein